MTTPLGSPICNSTPYGAGPWVSLADLTFAAATAAFGLAANGAAGLGAGAGAGGLGAGVTVGAGVAALG